MVSIICNSYNHEKYIKKTLDGFVMQKTKFLFEVLVHDDASTDSTSEIIREYEKKFPNIIKPIYQIQNKYSKNIDINIMYQYPRVKGKYIAICEGDDYWIDENKLQNQVDALELHPELDMCAHAAYVYSNGKKVSMISPCNNNCILPLEDVIQGGGGYIATNSCLYRTELLDTFPEFRKYYNIDYTSQIHGALRGGILYLSDYMSVYNYLTPESWSRKAKKNPEFAILNKNKIIQMYKILDMNTEKKYSDIIKVMILRCQYEIFWYKKEYKKIKGNSNIYSILSNYEKFKLFIVLKFPKIYDWLWKKYYNIN